MAHAADIGRALSSGAEAEGTSLPDFKRSAGKREIPAPGALENALDPQAEELSLDALNQLERQAAAQLAQGKTAAAAAIFRRILASTARRGPFSSPAEPWFTRSLFGLGDAYAAAGYVPEAVAFYEKAAGDNDPYGTGVAPETVAEAMERILKIDPAHPRSVRLLAQALMEQGVTQLVYHAEFEFNHTDVGDISKGEAHVRRGLELLARAAHYDADVVLGDPHAIMALSRGYLRLGEDQKALGFLVTAAARFPDDVAIAAAVENTQGFQALWAALELPHADPSRIEALQAAKAALTLALELDPAHPEAPTMMYRTLVELGDAAGARQFNEWYLSRFMDHLLRERVYPAGAGRPISGLGLVTRKATSLIP